MAATGQAGGRQQCFFGGVGIRVVTVVDHQETGRRRHDFAAVGRRSKSFERGCEIVEREAQLERAGGRGQAIFDVVEPVDRQYQAPAALRRFEQEGGPRPRVCRRRDRPQIAAAHLGTLGFEAVGEHAATPLTAETIGDAHHPRIVGIGHHRAAIGNTRQQLGLGFGNGIKAGEIFEVHGAHIGEHRDVRPTQAAHAGQLAGCGHAHFRHHPLAVFLNTQQSQRETEEVVVVARAFFGAEALAEERRDQLLGGGFAGRAGNAHQVTRHLAADGAGECVQRFERVADPNRRHGPRQFPFDHHRGGTRLKRGGHEVVAVGLFAPQGEKEFAAAHPTRIESGPEPPGRGVPAQQFAAQHRRRSSQAVLNHGALPPQAPPSRGAAPLRARRDR